MKTVAVIAILALLTITGAVYTDQLWMGAQYRVSCGELRPAPLGRFFWGDFPMLSLDQFLRFISVPAVIAAFLIASQISGGVMRPAQEQMTGQ